MLLAPEPEKARFPELVPGAMETVEDQACSSSDRLTPLSFHGLRSAVKLRVESIDMRDDLDTLVDPWNSV